MGISEYQNVVDWCVFDSVHQFVTLDKHHAQNICMRLGVGSKDKKRSRYDIRRQTGLTYDIHCSCNPCLLGHHSKNILDTAQLREQHIFKRLLEYKLCKECLPFICSILLLLTCTEQCCLSTRLKYR